VYNNRALTAPWAPLSRITLTSYRTSYWSVRFDVELSQILTQTIAMNRSAMTKSNERQLLLRIREVLDSILGPYDGHPDECHHFFGPFGQTAKRYLLLRHKRFISRPPPPSHQSIKQNNDANFIVQ
jgi:hypothetical protein